MRLRLESTIGIAYIYTGDGLLNPAFFMLATRPLLRVDIILVKLLSGYGTLSPSQ